MEKINMNKYKHLWFKFDNRITNLAYYRELYLETYSDSEWGVWGVTFDGTHRILYSNESKQKCEDLFNDAYKFLQENR